MKIEKVDPKEGQESVWDYPRPPRSEKFDGNIKIVFKGDVIIDTNDAIRILETSHPPVYYLPINQFKPRVLKANSNKSVCEFKGVARYYDMVNKGEIAIQAAWRYPDTGMMYGEIHDCVAVYAHLMDACYVNGELVKAQDGDFYGGWITSNIVGPFKGRPGTWRW